MEEQLYKCGKCKDQIAVWWYAPGYTGKKDEDSYFCDDCISSPDDEGCSCNWYHLDVNAYTPPIPNPEIPEGIEGKDWRWVNVEKDTWEHLDEKGRPYPCCEFWYDKDGWKIYKDSIMQDYERGDKI